MNKNDKPLSNKHRLAKEFLKNNFYFILIGISCTSSLLAISTQSDICSSQDQISTLCIAELAQNYRFRHS